MSIGIEDLKSQLSSAIDAVPTGMVDPLEALYARDKKRRRLTLPALPEPSTKRSPTMGKRWIAIFVVGLAVCLVALLAVNIGRTTAPRINALGGGSNSQAKIIVWLRSQSPATHAQLENASAVLARRLRAGGITKATAVVSAGQVVVTSIGQTNEFKALFDALLVPGNLLFRPVLCAVPAYKASSGSGSMTLPSTCPSANLLSASNLDVNVNTQTPRSSPSPWEALADTPSTPASKDSASTTVLLPAGADGNFSGDRLLLGPAEVTGQQVASASALFESPSWVVNLTLNAQGSIKWDMLATQQFHAYIAVDLDGTVVSAPLTMPAQSSITSFGGKVQLSAGFNEAAAKNLALDLASGPLPVALKEVSAEEVTPTVIATRTTKVTTQSDGSTPVVPIAVFQSRNANGTTPAFTVRTQNWQIRYDFGCTEGSEPYRITLLPGGRLVTSSASNKPAGGGESDFLESGAGTYRLQIVTPSTCSWSVSIYPWA
jgi:hypothetical protein